MSDTENKNQKLIEILDESHRFPIYEGKTRYSISGLGTLESDDVRAIADEMDRRNNVLSPVPSNALVIYKDALEKISEDFGDFPAERHKHHGDRPWFHMAVEQQKIARQAPKGFVYLVKSEKETVDPEETHSHLDDTTINNV